MTRRIAGDNVEVRKFDLVHDEPLDPPYDLIATRTVLLIVYRQIRS
jgi:chemotaxis methyl-accepting protein methylase